MAIHDDPATDNVLGESTNLQLVRLRLFLALVTMFAIPIVITAPMVYGLAWGFGASLVLPTLALLALAGPAPGTASAQPASSARSPSGCRDGSWSPPSGSRALVGSSRTPTTGRAPRRCATR